MNDMCIYEQLSPGIQRCWEINQVAYSIKTAYQDVLIGETSQGTTLFCDNERQSTEETQLIYHEGQIFPAVLLAKNFNKILIIGSSEGVVSQIALKSGAEKIVHVDIDKECVEACAKYLPYGYSLEEYNEALKGNGKISLVIKNGIDYVENCLETNKKFDVVVVDLPDEDVYEESSPQNMLYAEVFLRKLEHLLYDGGVVIAQAGCSTVWRNKGLKKMLARANNIFASVVYFEMEEQNWSWIVGMNTACENPQGVMKDKLASLFYKPKYIDEFSIEKSLVIPISIRNFEEAGR